MRAVSNSRARENRIRRQAMIEVRIRDGHECVGSKINPITGMPYLPEPCFGPLNGHEIITRGDGGSITDPANIILLCDFHNGWCTEHDDEAIAFGFREKRWSPYSPNVATRLPHSVIAVMEEGAQKSLDFILEACVSKRAVPALSSPSAPVRLAEVLSLNSKRPAPPCEDNADLSDKGDSR